MGEIQGQPFQLSFNASLQVDFQVPALLPTAVPRAGCANSTSDSVRKINRTTSEDQQLVAHQLAAKVGKDRRTFGQARPLLLPAPGRGPCDSTTVWEHGPADRVAALASGIGRPPTERISVGVGEGPERCQGNRSKEG